MPLGFSSRLRRLCRLGDLDTLMDTDSNRILWRRRRDLGRGIRLTNLNRKGKDYLVEVRLVVAIRGISIGRWVDLGRFQMR